VSRGPAKLATLCIRRLQSWHRKMLLCSLEELGWFSIREFAYYPMCQGCSVHVKVAMVWDRACVFFCCCGQIL
jgi:hypothetical protein